jgi:tetratricopeptide (TPR) repeat protein
LLVRKQAGLVDQIGQHYFEFAGPSAILPLQLPPLEAINDVLLQAIAAEDAGDFAAAAAHYRQAIALDEGDAVLHFNLGNVLAELGDATAQTEYERSVELDPQFADAWNNLGRLLLQRGDKATAERALRTALACEPGHELAAGNLRELKHRSSRSNDPNRWQLRLVGGVDDGEELDH